MTLRLTGQLIGSIRRVWFEPAEGPESAGNLRAPAPGETSSGAIEIETKGGQHAHLIADRELGAIRVCSGATRSPAGAVVRRWQDLTAAVPAAFDGRPAITAMIAVELVPAGDGMPTARAWRLELSTGATLWCRLAAAGLEFGTGEGLGDNPIDGHPFAT